MYVWLCWVFAAACRLSLVLMSVAVAGYRLLISVASLVAECGSKVHGCSRCGTHA